METGFGQVPIITTTLMMMPSTNFACHVQTAKKFATARRIDLMADIIGVLASEETKVAKAAALRVAITFGIRGLYISPD
jgi:hypothetical protein